VRALRQQSEREARKAEDRLARVRRDYQDGKIEADDWAEQRDQLTTEHQAAQAEVERLSASEQEAHAGGDLIDVEAETLRRLSEVRRAVSGEVRDAADTDAVRAALARLFDGFVVHRELPERTHVELIGRIWIEPLIPEQALEYGETVIPTLREPLQQAGNNEYVGFASDHPKATGHANGYYPVVRETTG
jgi:hypothetical protein